MRVLIAPLELKGTLTADEAANAIAEGLSAAGIRPSLTLLPLADGGPGTLATIERARRASLIHATPVTAADGTTVEAHWLVSDEQAIIESAQAVGITRLSRLAPLEYSSIGVGQLIRAALDAGHRRIAVTVGGSGTVDLGLGCALALGVRFRDEHGNEVEPLPRNLERVVSIDVTGLDPRLARASLEAWVDVRAPVLGADGCVYRYGGQKGLDVAAMPWLEEQASRLMAGRTSYPGDGAGGGLGWALRELLGAEVRSGFEALAQHVDLGAAIEDCDFIITAEGRLDSQSQQGKGTWALAQRARLAGRPIVLMTGAAMLSSDVWRTVFTDVVVMGPIAPTSRDAAYAHLVSCVRAYAVNGPMEMHLSL